MFFSCSSLNEVALNHQKFQRANQSATHVGCLPEYIEISHLEINGSTWLANCEGESFVCSENVSTLKKTTGGDSYVPTNDKNTTDYSFEHKTVSCSKQRNKS
jgi:hypothetical protein